MKKLGTIKEIWRYPVKSMRGEMLQHCTVGNKGIMGDRGWAVRDDTVMEVRGGRYLPGLLNCQARYTEEPKSEPYPAATITMPDGEEVSSNSPVINEWLSKIVGKPVSIWPIQPPDNTEHYRRLPLDEATLRKEFAREPGEPIPDLTQFPEILMKYVSIPGTYFDVTPLQLLTTSSLAYMQEKNPQSNWSTKRFRPNLVIDTGNGAELVENSWLGKRIQVGDVEISCEAPTPRCAITAHSQGDEIEKDPKILRTIVRESDQNLGLYCNVQQTGQLKIGAEVILLD